MYLFQKQKNNYNTINGAKDDISVYGYKYTSIYIFFIVKYVKS